ncbi:MAG: hypothetical protein JNJ83_19570 [Verrucomicrobiaceae bacterium]|nr:hypothetical protein [Verrucomicrobiaceae bacterium]
MKSLLLLSLLAAVAVSAQDADKVTVADLNFAVTAPWKSIAPSSSMRKATLQYPVDGLEKPLEAIFYHFPGGDVPSNIERWKGQIQGADAPKVEEVTVGTTKVTFFHATGTYTDPFAGLGAQENYAMLGALIPVEGSGPVAIKLAGPKAAVDSIKEAFKKMVSSPFQK